ncbi:MAG TPA: hypothetical protein VGS97_14810 [Actinocrinis sp.]|uniref:hypothetical protein n=1 Tax=Actinocrinis sp. TaxID=1920516 RepID=UPI002DDD11A1|nr:hypothetical protein [Actinocrinis sp.]HEV2345368.1 hypothetical protein [Actinocrinis sp.]
MTVPAEGALTLFGEPEPAVPQTRGRGSRPAPTAQDPLPDGGQSIEVFDPSRWVVVGWRDAKDSPFTPGQILAVLSHHTTQGPCARCGTPHHRYGEGGAPLCPACRTPSVTRE